MSRSAFLGEPGEILVSDQRTYPSGRISIGGAEKAERRRAQGAARQLLPSSEAVPERTRGRRGEPHLIRQIRSQRNQSKSTLEFPQSLTSRNHLNHAVARVKFGIQVASGQIGGVAIAFAHKAGPEQGREKIENWNAPGKLKRSISLCRLFGLKSSTLFVILFGYGRVRGTFGESPKMEFDTPRIKNVINDDTSIWRYMDLPKFVSMLANRGLWFTKAAALGDDPYEGFCKAKYLEIAPGHQGHRRVVRRNAQGKTIISVEQMIAGISHLSAKACENARDHLYVNSWCLGACESMAMWQIYGSLGCGVAVKSSVGQYQRAARFDVPSSQYAFGKVKYHSDLKSSPAIRRDFSRGSIPVGEDLWNEVLKLGFHKRSCYEYENEWRAAVYQDSQPENGFYTVFDLEQLISAIYVGPRAEKFFLDAVSSILDKFLLKKQLDRSDLLSRP